MRRIAAHADAEYHPWQQLVLAESDRGASQLRARQITEALRKLEEYDLLRIPRSRAKRGGVRFGPDGKTTWQLHTRRAKHPDYLVPNPTPGTFRIPREFFTNLWIFALTDTEIAAYLTLTFLRWRFPAQHYARGVYLLDTKTISASRGPPGAPLISCTGFGLLTAHLHPGGTFVPARSATTTSGGRTEKSCHRCSRSIPRLCVGRRSTRSSRSSRNLPMKT